MANPDKIAASLRRFAEKNEYDFNTFKHDISWFVLGNATIAAAAEIRDTVAPWVEGQTMADVYEGVSDYLIPLGIDELDATLIAGIGSGVLHGYTFDEAVEEDGRGTITWTEHGKTDGEGNPLLDDKIIIRAAQAMFRNRELCRGLDRHQQHIIDTDERIQDFSSLYREAIPRLTSAIINQEAISSTETDFAFEELRTTLGG